MRRPPSFRAQILLIVLIVGVAPLAVLGLWLAGSAARSGEALLRTRLGESLDSNAAAIELGWVRYRSMLLDVGEDPEVQRALRGGDVDADALRARFAALDASIQSVRLRDARGRDVADYVRRDPAVLLLGSPYQVALPVHRIGSDVVIGTLHAALPLEALRSGAGGIAAVGGVLTALDVETGAVLLPTPLDPALLGQGRFHLGDEEWIAVRRTLGEPNVELMAAAPIAPFTVPFRRAARDGAIALVLVALLGTALAAALTRRLTGSLERLATAADAVAAGDLRHTVRSGASAEFASVARAFNTMTASLRATLDQLAERESLSAVNEFAAALAHEVRNPLSAIQLDLQQVEEQLPANSELRALQEQALQGVRQLDRTVAGALDTARSGRVELRRIDLRAPLRDAAHAALPRFELRSAHLELADEKSPVFVIGDAAVLERLFLNLLLNAADALGPAGAAHVTLDTSQDDDVIVAIRDEGEGIPAEQLTRIFDAFYTTRPGGTGIGLAVARRIVSAHRGEIRVASSPQGTVVTVRLPRTARVEHSVPAHA